MSLESTPRGRSAATDPRQRRQEVARRPRHGIKLRQREGVINHGRFSGPWLDALERRLPPEALSEGLEFARIGQTVSLDMEEGVVVGRVQDLGRRPAEARITCSSYPAEAWEGVIEAMAGEAMYLVKMLAGEIPSSFETVLAKFDLTAIPTQPEDMTLSCTCKAGGICRHVATIGYLLGERLDADARLVLTLRGMASERVLERLRQARTLQSRGVSNAHVDPLIPESQEEPAALEGLLEEYWRPPAKPHTTTDPPPSKHVNHALLRRLGPSPLGGKFPLVGLLASIYDAVSEDALEPRDQAERV